MGLAGFRLVVLTFICSSIAAARVLRVGTRHAPLIGLQQMTVAVSAATGVARIDRGASREQSHGLGGSAVALQGSEVGVDVVQIAGAIEIASVIAAQVVTVRGQCAVAVSPGIVRDNGVLEYRRSPLSSLKMPPP